VIENSKQYVFRPKPGYVVPERHAFYVGHTVTVIGVEDDLAKVVAADGSRFYTDTQHLQPAGEPEEDVPDTIHPDHYRAGMEPIDYIRTFMSRDEFNAFCTGNVIKYVTRHGKKNGLDDLKKAARYIQYMIDYEDDKNAEA